ncbi:hypothetical protein ACFQ1S_07710 [Kibdelosporangium lantanae]|uniref:Secreted protein n=1 Tax=Kibdelosporangium lantanae TaxID=1497396 RepID=A0ABW3M790_9PSEU
MWNFHRYPHFAVGALGVAHQFVQRVYQSHDVPGERVPVVQRIEQIPPDRAVLVRGTHRPAVYPEVRHAQDRRGPGLARIHTDRGEMAHHVRR